MSSLGIRDQLKYKYDNLFYFYIGRSINEILYNHTSKLSTIRAKDISALAEQNEYLKRYYYLENKHGHFEIQDRVRLLSGIYSQAINFKYEIPLMILTRTEDIFVRRLRRIKKTADGEGSSDDTPSKQQKENQTVSFSGIFLESLDENFKFRRVSNRSSFAMEGNSIMQHSQYNIHKDPAEIEQESEKEGPNQMGKLKPKEIKLKVSDSQVCLNIFQLGSEQKFICDFQEFDEKEILTKYEIIQKKLKKKYPSPKLNGNPRINTKREKVVNGISQSQKQKADVKNPDTKIQISKTNSKIKIIDVNQIQKKSETSLALESKYKIVYSPRAQQKQKRYFIKEDGRYAQSPREYYDYNKPLEENTNNTGAASFRNKIRKIRAMQSPRSSLNSLHQENWQIYEQQRRKDSIKERATNLLIRVKSESRFLRQQY